MAISPAASSHVIEPFPALADPSLQGYLNAGLERRFGAVQQSGTFAFLADGREVFVHRTTAPMRRPDLGQLLERLLGCARSMAS